MSHSRATKRGRSALPAVGLALVAALFAMCVLMLGHAASAHAEHRAGVSAGAASAVAPQPVIAVHTGNGHEDHAAARAAAAPAASGAIPFVAAAASAAVTPAPAAVGAEAASANGLGGMHGDAHGAMMLMVCAMALLTVAVLLLAPRVLRGLRPRFAPLRARALIAAARLPKPRPPSLIVLSISRT